MNPTLPLKGSSSQSGSAVFVYGGLFPPDFLRLIASFSAPFQGGEDYGVPRGLSLRDETGRWWRIAQGEWEFLRSKKTEEADPFRWIQIVLTKILSFDDIVPIQGETVGERRFPITHLSHGGTVPLVLVPSEPSLDKTGTEWGDDHRKRSPHGLLQEFLNARPTGPRWGIVFNGKLIRLVRENPSLTRPAYIEADLERILEEDLYPDFVLFCLLCHVSRFLPPKEGEEPVLEIWRHESEKTGERAREELRNGVQRALESLGNGFLAHSGNESLRKAFACGVLSAQTFHQQLLRLVYRFLFLMTIEDRDLLHERKVPKEIRNRYREGYSISNFRDRAQKQRFFDEHSDLWQGLRITFEGLACGSPALGLSPLGGIFSPDQCSHLVDALLDNASLLSAVRALGYFESSGRLVRINYRDMDTEELGSVYEGLLELHPVVDVDGSPWRFLYVGSSGGKKKDRRSGSGSERKSSGSYYTPDSLVQELIRSALDPVIHQVLLEDGSSEKALLGLRIVDPACGSGHFLLAAARRLALELARVRMQTDSPDETSRRHALREVVAHTIFGVDMNPLAVELCRTALWIETVDPGKPLGFLDNHILCGNSLVGLVDMELLKKGIPGEAYAALTGDDKEIAKQIKKRNKPDFKSVMPRLPFRELPAEIPEAGIDLDALPEETLEDISRKEKAWKNQISAHDPERLAADLFVAAFFLPKTEAVHGEIPVSDDLNRVLQGKPIAPEMRGAVEDCAKEFRFFHWPTMFPEVFLRGGFDVVLGNPPWEKVKLQEKEFFKNRMPEIAGAPKASVRKKMIEALEADDPHSFGGRLYQEFLKARKEAEAESQFVRTAGRFPLTGRGDVNTYAVFSETILALLNPQGRAGFLVQTGIATDDTTKVFFDYLIKNGRLVSLYDFENREGIFPDLHRTHPRFCLLTLGQTDKMPEFIFFATNTNHLLDDRRRYSLSEKEIRLFNPNTGTTPTFRSQKDKELTRKIYAASGVFFLEGRDGEPDINHWEVKFSRLFDMSNDSGLFRTAAQLLEMGGNPEGPNFLVEKIRYVPLYEAKMVHYYDHRFATYEENGMDTRDVLDSEKTNPEIWARPRYWVRREEVDRAIENILGRIPGEKRGWLLGWRDVSNATNERTVIAGVIPRVGVGNKFPLIFSNRSEKEIVCLIGNLSSLIFDYAARQKVGGTTLNFFIMKQFSIFPPEAYPEEEKEFLATRILELVYTARDLEPFARDLGYDGAPFPWDPDRRAILRAEIDAFFAKKYGLTREDLLFVLDPAEVCGEDYPTVTFPGLRNNEVRDSGEYRTKRLILEAWDRLYENEGGCKSPVELS